MRISTANLPKISRFHHIPGSGTSRPHFLKIFLISLGFAYDFAFCKNNGFVRIIQRKLLPKTLGIEKLFLGGNYWNIIQGNVGVNRSKNVKILEFQKVEIWKDNEFLKWFPISSCMFCNIFMRNTGSQGPLRVQKIEKFRSSQNHPKSIRIDQESIISHFGTTKTP